MLSLLKSRNSQLLNENHFRICLMIKLMLLLRKNNLNVFVLKLIRKEKTIH